MFVMGIGVLKGFFALFAPRSKQRASSNTPFPVPSSACRRPGKLEPELCAKCGTFHRYTGGVCRSLEQKPPPDPEREALARREADELGREIRKSLEREQEAQQRKVQAEQEAKERDDEKREQEAREFLIRESERVQREREEQEAQKKNGA